MDGETIALLEAQICIYFKHAHRYLAFIKHSYMLRDRTVSDIFLLAVCCCKSQYMYEYIIESKTPLSELKTFPNCKETCAFSKARETIANLLRAYRRTP